MLIELWRKVTAEEYAITSCVICGDDFDRGNVFVVADADDGSDLGEMCPTCFEHLDRRKSDAENPARGNWPSSEWPIIEDLEEARRRYPGPMFSSAAEMERTAPDFDAEDEVLQASRIWKMKPEGRSRTT